MKAKIAVAPSRAVHIRLLAKSRARPSSLGRTCGVEACSPLNERGGAGGHVASWYAACAMRANSLSDPFQAHCRVEPQKHNGIVETLCERRTERCRGLI
jgi:hypothetical protein